MLTVPPDRLCGLEPEILFAPLAGAKIIGLAVSGGADSLALMLLYGAWAPAEGKPKAIVYTLDHGLRPEARGEAEAVVETARRLGLEARLLTWTGDKPKAGRQRAARTARYRLIGEAMRAEGAEILATGHHRRDQAETVLMRLAHGSGVSGLAGMRTFSEVEGVRVFRPLLNVPADTLATIVARGRLCPAIDPSNTDQAYERTRWRDALPALSELGLTEESLSRAARRFARIDALAENLVAAFGARHLSLDALGAVHIEREALAGADPEIAVRALGWAIDAAAGRRGFDLARTEALTERILKDTSFTATLAGVRIRTGRDSVLLHRETGRAGLRAVTVSAGETVCWDGRFTITAAVPVVVESATGMTREGFRRLTGAEPPVPVWAVRAAPLVRDRSGAVLTIGALNVGTGVTVSQPPLTAWRPNCVNRPPGPAGALVSPE